MAMALLLSLRGTPCIYQGEELGLTEADIAFLPSLPELAFLETHLSNLDMSVVDAILKRCPKLKYARI